MTLKIKKVKIRYLLLLLVVVFFTSCNFSEEVTFSEDGSGEFSISYDMNVFMREMRKRESGSKEKKSLEK